MKKSILYCFLIFSTTTFGQNWKKATEAEAYPDAKAEYQDKRNQKILKLDRNSLDQVLKTTFSKRSKQTGTIVTIPNADGELERFEVWESSNFSPKDQAKYSNIRSYAGKSIIDPSSSIRFSTGPSGISSTIFRANDNSEFLETYSNNGDYVEVHRKSSKDTYNCLTPEVHEELEKQASKIQASNQSFKTYRLALSVTGEYSQQFGGTLETVLEAMNNTMTRVNGVFEKEMAINFVFANNIEKLIYFDPETDPYSNYLKGLQSDTEYRNASAWNVELQRNLRDNFGEENYDIGHLFGHRGGGGNAGCIGCICETAFPLGKGSGFTSPGRGLPKGDTFDIDFVAHEIGHQIGANHTFSNDYEGTRVQVEPGSGSTIMGYAGITYYNVQNNSDDYFSHASLKQVQDNLSRKSCGISRPILNTSPKIELLNTTYIIPVGTAFKLDAKVSDKENDNILVNWEQNDTGNYMTTDSDSRVKESKTIGPNFRSIAPTKNTFRYFPNFQSILDDKLINTENNNLVWESVTTVPRLYKFVVTARDYNNEGAQNDYKEVNVTVLGDTTPFKITSPSTEEKVLVNTENLNVTWNTGSTNLPPISVSKVKISVSWDGGVSFEDLGVVDNNGSASFPMPNNAKSIDNGYIMIEAEDNIFLAVKKFSTGTLSTKDLESKKANIYPNPSNGLFTIEHKVFGNIKIDIIDFNGRRVYNMTDYANGYYKKQMNLKLPAGVYILNITSNEGENSTKIIIK